MTQDDQILDHLERGNTITPLLALRLCGCLALHSAISRLRERGYAIDKIMRSENGKRFGEYYRTIPT